VLGSTAAGVDAERAVSAGLAARAPDNLGAERLAPLVAGEGATVFDELLARGGRLERLAQVIELSDFVDFGICFIFHIVLFLFCLSVSVKSLPPAFVLSSRDREAVHSESQLLPSKCRRTLYTIQLFIQRESIPSSPCGFLYLTVKFPALDGKLFVVFHIHIVKPVYHRL
jgi:hypothetical protein